MKSFMAGVANVTSLSLGSNFPTILSVPHSFMKSYMNVLAIAISTDYTFFKAEEIKDRVAFWRGVEVTD